MKRPLVLAITGASGSVYAVRLLQQLLLANQSVHLVVSSSAQQVLQHELRIESQHLLQDPTPLLTYCWPKSAEKWLPISLECAVDIAERQLSVFHIQDFLAPMASGSFLTSGMIVCPCSGATLSGIVHAAGNNLIQRAADVHLKEHRKLILVPRETPLSVFQIENMHRAAQAGAVVLPAMPGWYQGVESLVDIIDFVVARILDHLAIAHTLMPRWGNEENSELALDDLEAE